MTSANVLQELEWRGFVQQATPGLAAHFAKGPVTAYCGFDPTAPSLQLGNLMPLMLLANLQRPGNRPIVLMGGCKRTTSCTCSANGSARYKWAAVISGGTSLRVAS